MANNCWNQINFPIGFSTLVYKDLLRLSKTGQGAFFNVSDSGFMEKIEFAKVLSTLKFATEAPNFEGFIALCACFDMQGATLSFEDLDSGDFGDLVFKDNAVTIRELTAEDFSKILEIGNTRVFVLDGLDGVRFTSKHEAARTLLDRKPFVPFHFQGGPAMASTYVNCFNEFARIFSAWV